MSCIFNFLDNMLETKRKIKSIIAFDNSVMHIFIQCNSIGIRAIDSFFNFVCFKPYLYKLQKCYAKKQSQKKPTKEDKIKDAFLLLFVILLSALAVIGTLFDSGTGKGAFPLN